MAHIYKVQLQFADMFVRELNLETSTISYEIRDKDTGVLMESATTAQFVANELEQKIFFSNGRFIAIGLALLIAETLR